MVPGYGSPPFLLTKVILYSFGSLMVPASGYLYFHICLMLARKTPYQNLADQFPLYKQLEELASDKKNHTILR